MGDDERREERADSRPSRRRLREVLLSAFDLDEIEQLCFELREEIGRRRSVDLPLGREVVGGDDKQAIALNLIEYLARRGYLDQLVAAVRRARPGLL